MDNKPKSSDIIDPDVAPSTTEKPAQNTPPVNQGMTGIEESNIAVEDAQAPEPAQEEALLNTYNLPVDGVKKSHGHLFNKKLFIIGGAVVVLSIAAIASLWATRSNTKEEPVASAIEEPAKPVIAATLSKTEGSVEASPDGENWESIAPDTAIENLSYVRTTSNARASIDLSEGSVVRLNSGTTVQMRTLNEDTVVLAVLGGEVYSHVAEDASRDFEVSTSATSFKARGTIYRTVNSDTLEGVEVYEGAVTEKSGTDIDAGKSLFVKNTQNPDTENTVTELDKNSLASDDFIAWNITEDAANRSLEGSGILDDLVAPELTITSPSVTELETEESSIEISGSVSEADATVTVNDKNVSVNAAGDFTQSVELTLGANTITIVATDAGSNTSTQTITVTRNAAETEADNAITLEGAAGSTGINVSWSHAETLNAANGYQVVYSTTPTPVYGQASAQRTDDKVTVIPQKDGQVYYIRVCTYNPSNDTCSNYSNEISATAPTQ
jgi:hypothetical protein